MRIIGCLGKRLSERWYRRCVRVKRENIVLVNSGREVKGVWKEHFEHLINEEATGEACVEYGYGSRCLSRETERWEVRKKTATLKYGKAAGTYGITFEILKYSGDTAAE